MIPIQSDKDPAALEFEKLAQRYENDPSLQNYIAIRKEFQNADVTLKPLADANWNQDLWEGASKGKDLFGVQNSTVSDVIDGEQEALDLLCLQLGRAWIMREVAKSDGATHLSRREHAISVLQIANILALALEAAAYHSMKVPPSMAVLSREFLLKSNPVVVEASKRQMRKTEALYKAGRMKHEGKPIGIRAVARELDVAPSTVKRWFEDTGGFDCEFEKYWEMMGKRFRLVPDVADET